MANAVRCISEIDRLVSARNQILLTSDFDGTLCPITDCPSNVVVPAIIREILPELIGSRRVVIAIISGRALDDLMQRLPLPLIFAGNHGLTIRGPAFRFEHPGARRLRRHLAKACKHISRAIEEWEGAWVENKILTAAVHYRHVDKTQHYALIRTVRQCVFAHNAQFGMRTGQEAIEIHPRVAWNKGSCLRWIKRQLKMESSASICIGDDPADDSMFAANVNQLNIRVGTFRGNAASCRVSDVFEVAALLAHLEQAVRSESATSHLAYCDRDAV